MNPVTTDPLVSPATPAELAAWLRLDDDTDPVLQMLLNEATEIVRAYLGYDVSESPRQFTYTMNRWPVSGTDTYPNLSRRLSNYSRGIRLPWANLISVESVTVWGEVTTDFDTLGNVLAFNDVSTQYDSGSPALAIEYTAGYDVVPQQIITNIIRVAAFLYEHRGKCEVIDAIEQSGAGRALTPYRNPDVMVIM